MLPLLAAYVATGIIVALAFVIAGVTKVQPMPVTLGARVVLWPGAFLLWPYVAARWLKSLSACSGKSLPARKRGVDTGVPKRTCADAQEVERIPVHSIGMRSSPR